jgi:Ca-activated chloride channel homolog
VIAMPRPMAEAMGWPKAQIGWRDLFELAKDSAGWGRFGHPEWGRFKLGKTNPDFSTSGLNALIGEYYAATGTSSDLTRSDITDPKVVRFVKGVESSVVHYGDISITFLSNLRRADEAGQGLSYISAVAIEEKSVWDYNQGNPSGDPATVGQQAPPSTPLVAIYPKEGTLVNDHPYAILNAPWVSPAKRAVGEDFLRFVQAPNQQARFQEAGFRDFRGRPGAPINPGNGLLADEPKVELSTPSAPVLTAIQRSWSTIRKRARVLLVIDVSGSMGEGIPSSGASKLTLAKEAALRSLSEFAPGDEVGLWDFSDGRGRHGEPYAQISPVSRLGPKLDRLRRAIRSLRPSGGTALYATLNDATKMMSAGFDPARINGIVVLTDGRNDYYPFESVDPVIAQLTHQPSDRAIRVFCIAYGDDADSATLGRISDASLGVSYDATDPATIDQVFADVISNF